MQTSGYLELPRLDAYGCSARYTAVVRGTMTCVQCSLAGKISFGRQTEVGREPMNVEQKVRNDRFAEGVPRLVGAPLWRIGEVVEGTPVESKVRGVYLMSLPDDPESLMYVGRTKSKTVHGRLCDHCRINTGSDLRGMLLRRPQYPQASADNGLRWIEVADSSERAYLELFAIAILQPVFNRP